MEVFGNQEEEEEEEADEEAQPNRRPDNKTPLPYHATSSLLPAYVPDTRYRECLKNHAVSIGGHAIDGCGEFMASGPDGFKCAACRCHRSFHRRENIAFLPPSPLPLNCVLADEVINLDRNRRHRTKFTPELKERMAELAEKIGWRMQKQDESLVERFCEAAGIKRHAFKVWMHNNKHTLLARDGRIHKPTTIVSNLKAID